MAPENAPLQAKRKLTTSMIVEMMVAVTSSAPKLGRSKLKFQFRHAQKTLDRRPAVADGNVWLLVITHDVLNPMSRIITGRHPTVMNKPIEFDHLIQPISQTIVQWASRSHFTCASDKSLVAAFRQYKNRKNRLRNFEDASAHVKVWSMCSCSLRRSDRNVYVLTVGVSPVQSKMAV